jgi:uncharacterized membrane protein YfcA
MMMLFVYVPAIIVEDAGIISSLTRSRFLMDGIKARTFGVLFIMRFAGGIIGGLIGGIGAAVALSTKSSGMQIPFAAALSMVQAFFMVLTAAIEVVTYFDGRVRRENFGIENLAELFD